jgi:hypothetical protein
MNFKTLLMVLLVPMLILLVPLTAMQFTDEVNWDAADFVIAWVLMTTVGLVYKLLTNRANDSRYRLAVGIAVAAGVILVWGNLAVGFIGSEDHPANLMYFGVLAAGAIGSAIARFKPHGMSLSLFAMAFLQAMVPVIALIIWQPPFSVGVLKVFILNSVFVVLFAVSGFLFRKVGRDQSGPLGSASS